MAARNPYPELTIEDIPADIAEILEAEDRALAEEAANRSPRTPRLSPSVSETSLTNLPAQEDGTRRAAPSQPDEAATTLRAGQQRRASLAVNLLAAIRWVLMLPASFLGMTFAFYIVQIGNRISMPAVGVDPDDFLARLFTEFIGGVVQAGAFIAVGHRVAPIKRMSVAYFLAGIVLITVVILSSFAYSKGDHWTHLSSAGGVFGLIGAVQSISERAKASG